MNSNVTLIGILSSTPNNFDRLNLAVQDLLKSSGQTRNLTASTFPTQAPLLQSFGVIILDNFPTNTLSPAQLTTLQSWINQGGNLVVVGGPEWQSTIGTLPTTLLPVTPNGSGSVPAGTTLLPVSSIDATGHAPKATLNTTVPITLAQAQSGSTVIQSAENGKVPLIAETMQGQGSIYYLAYDPTLEPLASWPSTNDLWKGLLLRTLGDKVIANGTNGASPISMQLNTAASLESLLQIFFPNSYPSVWLLLALLIGYLLILGPVRLLIVRRFRRRNWSWRITLTAIVVFTLLSYGLALNQKGTSIINSSISILQLNRHDSSGTTGHLTTYLGVFVPNQGDFNVHIPGPDLVSGEQGNNQFQYQPYRTQSTTQQTTITTTPNGTDVDLQGVDIWTNRTLVAQRDTHATGGLTSHLQLHLNTVSGTVTNTLPYNLDDVYIAMGNDYVALGNFPSNSTKQVSISLNNSLNPANSTQSTIADQIASARGMQTGQGFYYQNNSSNAALDEAKRHALMLEALSGDSCNNYGCYQQGGQIITPNGTRIFTNGLLSNTSDPVLLHGAPATLIGWVKSPVTNDGDVTINGSVANGTKETLVQAPLDVAINGAVQIPSTLINTTITHLQQDQNTNIQEAGPGSYTLTTGSMTFEYTLPGIGHLENGSLNFTSNANINKMSAQNIGVTSDINHLQAYLYNWQTGNWDSYSFSQFALTIKDAKAYIGPGNRVLLNLNNQSTDQGTFLFDQPELNMNGTING
jgi:uncharacterized membrane protein YhaH (DUF805 family)